MLERNLVLVGFMGTGKSTVGKALAKKLGRTLVDVDHVIEEREKRRISEIFERDGESAFRKLEKDAIREVSTARELVITTGGGAVIDPENLAALKSGGVVVLLEADVQTIYQRVKDTRHRPLLSSNDLRGEIERLLKARQPHYDQADFKVSTDGKTAAQVADEILEALQNEEKFEFGKDLF